jgi:HD-GYP domain-containing protein (c-di-GMP phosphodiesterase class II)
MIGRLLGYDRETLKKLAAGCALHDIGKIFIDAAILDKPTALTSEEWAQVKEHTVLGYLFLRDNLRIGLLAAHVAYQHHERQDGQGYPRGLAGTNRLTRGAEIHLPGRVSPLGEIAAIADFHDACSSDRPHRRRLPPDRVWQMVRAAAGAQLNREITEVFLAALPPYPLGTRVVVTAGRYRGYAGVVAKLHAEELRRPVVRILTDPGGQRINAVDVDLRREELAIRGVLSCPPEMAAVE